MKIYIGQINFFAAIIKHFVMNLIETNLSGLYIIEPTPFKDLRGVFARTYCKSEFQSIGFEKEFIQFNHSFNKLSGTLRGLHFQRPPYAETKYVRCVEGSIFDVAVDIRKGSSTYLQYFGIELSAQNMLGLLIPEGFAHGFQTLEDNTSVIYHATNYYNPNFEGGLFYNDNLINIAWKLPVVNLSEKDKSQPIIDNNFISIEV
jgi:dTDP-4-dehydrorhamnose 3,5-epimerase